MENEAIFEILKSIGVLDFVAGKVKDQAAIMSFLRMTF